MQALRALPVFLGAILTATPAPAPTLRTITHERVSPVCTAYRDLALPLALLQQRYEIARIALQRDEMRYMRYSGSFGANILYAARGDMNATNLLGNIHTVELALIDSYKAYPQHSDPKVDALRQGVQNVVDLDRAIANRYAEYFGTIVDNDGLGVLSSGAAFESLDRHGLPPSPRPTASPAAAPDTQSVPFPPARAGEPARRLKFEALTSLAPALDAQARRLGEQAAAAPRDCRG